jgi:hypothetical protein
LIRRNDFLGFQLWLPADRRTVLPQIAGVSIGLSSQRIQ